MVSIVMAVLIAFVSALLVFLVMLIQGTERNVRLALLQNEHQRLLPL